MTNTLEAPVVEQPHLPDYNARRLGFTAGVIAAAVMLLAIVILRLLSGVESLPEVVAEGILVNLPGALFSSVLDALQHSAKPLFFLAIGIGMLVVGGLLGRSFAGLPSSQRAIRIVLGVWIVFGVGVYTLLGAGIFGQHLQAGPVWHASSLLVVFAVYGLALWHAFNALVHRAMPALPDASRREFLRNAAVAMVATVGLGTAWRMVSGGPGDERTSAPLPSSAAPVAATLDDLAVAAPKTKEIAGFLKAIKVGRKVVVKGDQAVEKDVTLADSTVLIGTEKADPNVYKSARNIDGVEVLPAAEFNCYTVLKQKRLVLTRGALEVLRRKAVTRRPAATAAK